ncbi:FKBP-type peptidyl-prolyl cis-trans isomerase [Flavobacteriales bacterium]|nr:FKBP-type peptidyl-prolyl cis-trans isomerase [Flavobacteriales bacterium]
MKKILFIAMAAGTLAACNTTSTKDVSLNSFADSASYAVGTSIGLNLAGDFKTQGVDSSFNTDLVIAGLSAALTGDSADAKLSQEEAQEIVGRFFDEMNTKKASKNVAIGQAFLQENGAKPGVVTTASGLQYIVLKEGEGASPSPADQVRVHYTGKLLDGTVFDSSIERNEPVVFYVRSVIPGWTEALQLMKEGAEYKLFIPGNLAYGEQGNPRGGIGPNSVLTFDVKLIDVITEE